MVRIFWSGHHFYREDTCEAVSVQPVGNPVVLTYVNPTFNIRGNLDDILNEREVDKDLDYEKRQFNGLILTTPANAYSVTPLTYHSRDYTVLSLAFQFYYLRNL